MKKRIQSQPVVALSKLAILPSKSRGANSASAPRPEEKPVESGLLRLCQEIAGSLLRRRLESGDPVKAVREMRSELVKHLPDCNERRAGQLIDLALELIHVKANGSFKRNPLELSQLIARAGNQLRNVADN